ncbi:hypothetical protein NHX12_025933 [Muraenolepis orangiensis]|uniref:Cytokine receptor-like factor 2-like D1 domain-containing protein n=1 Tax=Muraenolepis orangiensis TaxID=630683 RepID=A0A9Q0EE53_9TELE|nr:hypothetical protein NHX12_025933 [Muraenolepis orangiensis]
MAVGLLLLLFCLNGLVWSEDQRPEVDCVVVNLDYVHCVWNGSTPPDFNYTFYSRFDGAFNPCARYVLDNSTVMGCDQRYEKLILKRSERFTTRLELGNRSFEQNHQLKSKVKLNPPTHLSVKNGTDFNLWFYWNNSYKSGCIVSEVRHRVEGKDWKSTAVQQKTSYCINLPSSSHRYELQVRNSIGESCGASGWSDWSPPVFWGSVRESNSTGTSGFVWTPVFCGLGMIILLLMVILLVKHERIKVILIPILPDPGKNLTKILAGGNIEDWLPISKSIKEGFKTDYSERTCSVREYSWVAPGTGAVTAGPGVVPPDAGAVTSDPEVGTPNTGFVAMGL